MESSHVVPFRPHREKTQVTVEVTTMLSCHLYSDTSSQAIFSLFSQLASAVQKTGEVITKLSRNYTEVPEIAEAGERVKMLSKRRQVVTLQINN